MEIFKRLAEINKKITAIGKNSRNQAQNFQYRGVDDVMNELHSLFAEYEVIILPELIAGSREERQSKSGGALITSLNDYKFTFVTTDGSNCFAIIRGEAMDSADKSSNKSIAVALKYALTQMFLIPTSEMKDPDAETHDVKATKKETLSKPYQYALKAVNEATDLPLMREKINESTKLTTPEKDALHKIINERIKK
jgi:hypothetical protein